MPTDQTLSSPIVHEDSAEALARDIAAVGRLGSVETILRLVCEITGMGFAAVARVTDETWTACAVRDGIGFGLPVGGQLELRTTLCHESRQTYRTIAFDQASIHPDYKDHHTPKIYGIESYFSTPIQLPNGTYFGNLCAIDRKPAAGVSSERTVAQMELFAQLIAAQLQSDDRFAASETARLDARAAADLREHFIAVLGHDLRNPLSALGASVALLERHSTHPKALRATTVMRASVRRMAALIEDVMDLARARLGSGIGARLVETDHLPQAVQDVCREIRAGHPEVQLDETIRITAPVRCDLGRMQQLLSNLLGNAIAHGDRSRPIRVEAETTADGVSISVVNEGPTIPPETLARVFEPFWRPSSGTPGGGLGLGLYICQEIAKAHGGAMSAASVAGHTRFTVRIPAGVD